MEYPRLGGGYILFLDADDYISPYTLEIGMKLAAESNADMIVGGLIHVDADEIPQFQEKENRTVLIDNRGDKAAFIMHMSGIKQQNFCMEKGQTGTSSCARLVKKEMAAQVPFENDRYWDEDDLWNITIVDRCCKILIVDVCWYAYVINPNSMVRGYAGDRTKEFRIRAKQEYQRIKSLYPECMQGAYYHIWDGLLRYCRTDTFQPANPKNKQERYTDFCIAMDFEEFIEAIKNIDFDYERRMKYRIVKRLLKILLLLKEKRPAFWALNACIKRIKF